MKNTLKVLIHGKYTSIDYKAFVEELAGNINKEVEFVDIENVSSSLEMASIDLALFTGGADVDPEMYGEPRGSRTGVNQNRDQVENAIFNTLPLSTPKLGICRGSQFLTVMNGGKLIQHVEGHATHDGHEIDIRTTKMNINGRGRAERNDVIWTGVTTSTHHQMMFPFNLPDGQYELLGWSTNFLSNTYLDGNDKEIDLPENFVEPEIVYYPQGNSLAIQGHPEMKGFDAKTKSKIKKLIIDKLLVK